MIVMVEAQHSHPAADKPSHLTGAANSYSLEDIAWIARQFAVPEPLTVAAFPGRGNINLHTYEVTADGKPYLLQKVNSDIFTMPHRVMNSMIASIRAQQDALVMGVGDPEWAPIELVDTKRGQPYLDLTDVEGWSVWRMMVKIPDSVSYKSLGEVPDRAAQLQLAREVGRGMGIYSDLTSSIDPNGVEGSLPGYRDTALYYAQFRSVMARNRSLDAVGALLPEDPILRASTEPFFLLAVDDAEFARRCTDPELAPFIQLVQEEQPTAMALWDGIRAGRIRKTLIHGDTKLENFLFGAATNRVKSLVDLDTVMPFTWLADWGDCLRSLVNVAGEKETDLDKVTVDWDVYDAVREGFLGVAREVTPEEVAMMGVAVQAIALELGLRFLTDYLRGDSYFQLGEGDPADLNKTRAMVQLTLFKRLRAGEAEGRTPGPVR